MKEPKIIINGFVATADEYKAIKERAIKNGARVCHASLSEDGENIDLKFQKDAPKFKRIRRITGYLVGTLERFNNAKRAEERDRVKHGMGENA